MNIQLTVLVTANSTELSLDVAVELLTAWSAAIAERRGIRALVIKGRSLAFHGLRAARTSADVDVLVDPARFEAFCAALESLGWAERPIPAINALVSPHSVAFVKDGWPADIDVHRCFPGFLADPSHVFEALWDGSVHLAFAHRDVRVPDRLSSWLIMALHALRDGERLGRSGIEAAARVPFTSAERADLAMLATATGCAGSLESVLRRAGIDPGVIDETDALRAWRARVTSESQGAFVWLSVWKAARWRERPGIAWRAVWPSADELGRARAEVRHGQRWLLAARLARLGRGVRGLGPSLRALKVEQSGTARPR